MRRHGVCQHTGYKVKNLCYGSLYWKSLKVMCNYFHLREQQYEY